MRKINSVNSDERARIYFAIFSTACVSYLQNYKTYSLSHLKILFAFDLNALVIYILNLKRKCSHHIPLMHECVPGTDVTFFSFFHRGYRVMNSECLEGIRTGFYYIIFIIWHSNIRNAHVRIAWTWSTHNHLFQSSVYMNNNKFSNRCENISKFVFEIS